MDKPNWNTREILDLLTPETLQLAAEAFWGKRPDVPDVDDRLVAALAQVMHFRPGKLRRLPTAKKVQYLLRYLRHDELENLRREMLIRYHLVHQQDLLNDFLDFWGLSHLQDDPSAFSNASPTPDQVVAARERFGRQYPPLDIAIFFATAGIFTPAWREALSPHVAGLVAAQATAEETAKPAARHQEQEEWLEDFPELTVVDHLLLETLQARADQSEGAFPYDQLAPLVDEFIQLNPERGPSYFHRGFLWGLSERKTEVHLPEDDPCHRTWHLAGQILSLSRQGCWHELVEVYDAHQDAMRELLKSETPRAPAGAAQLFQGLWSMGRKVEAAQVLPPVLRASTGADLIHLTVDLAESELAGHAPEAARLLLDQVLDARRDLGDSSFPHGLLARVDLMRARCLRGEHRWEESAALLQTLLQDDQVPAAEMHLNIGLAEAGITWVSDIQAPLREEDVAPVKERLEKGRPHFEKAVVDKRCVAAPYALGVLDLLDRQPSKATANLEKAYSRASTAPEAHRPGMLYEKIRLHYALALLSAFDEPHVPLSLEMLRETDRRYPAEEWPAWLLEQVAEIVDVSGTPASLELLEWLHGRLPEVTEIHLSDPNLVGRSPALRSTLSRRAAEARDRDPDSLWRDNTILVAAHLEGDDLNAASEVLGRLEELALKVPVLRDRFIDFLAQPENYHPAWDEEDALHSSAVVCEAAGQFQRAYTCLRTLFFRHKDQEDWVKAAGVIDEIQDYHLPEALVEEVMRQAPVVTRETVKEQDAISSVLEEYCRHGRSIRLLVVGGDEAQARHDAALQTYFEAEQPGLQVDFEHAPRTSSWNKYYDRVKGRMGSYDGLVLLRYMRTHMGRSLRALAGQLGTPWFPCTGKGRSSIQRSILHAARSLARSKGA